MTTRRIDSLESFDIDGATESVLLRGDLSSRRVLLIVQQGPGFPLIHEARALERRLHLEADIVVGYWDQRGTGKSWGADPLTINVVRLVADVRVMVDTLCARLRVDRLDILGLAVGAGDKDRLPNTRYSPRAGGIGHWRGRTRRAPFHGEGHTGLVHRRNHLCPFLERDFPDA